MTEKIDFLSWPQKDTVHTGNQLKDALEKCIKISLSGIPYNKDQTAAGCSLLNDLRKAATSTHLQRREVSAHLAQTLGHYHDQMMLLANKGVPIFSTVGNLNFHWVDAFNKKAFANSPNIAMDLMCVLYNLATVKMTIAAQSEQTGPELMGIFNNFKSAAGIIGHILQHHDQIENSVMAGNKVTKDIDMAALQAIQSVSLAQAQEIMVMKLGEPAAGNSTSAETRSKMAQKAANYYTDALEALQSCDSATHPRYATEVVSAKQCYYEALAQYYMGLALTCKERVADGIGEAIARFGVCEAKAKEGAQTANKWKILGFNSQTIVKAAFKVSKDAKEQKEQRTKENELIYGLKSVPAHLSPISDDVRNAAGKQICAMPNEWTGAVADVPINDVFGHLSPEGLEVARTMKGGGLGSRKPDQCVMQ